MPKPVDDLTARMHAVYLEGFSLAEVGERFNYTWEAVNYRFKSRGLMVRSSTEGRRLRHSRKVRNRLPSICADYEAGMSAYQLAAKYHLSEGTILNWLHEAGVEVRKRWER